MSQFVSEKSVFVNQNLESREALLRFVSDKAAEFGITDNADAVYDAFMAREAMGETGMTDGFAVPHAKSDDIKDAEKPVDVAIALLVPGGEAGTTHIKLLSKTAVLLMKDEFKNLVHGTDDAAAIADAINAGIDEE